MARMKKLKASTLVESLVAMVILSIVFAVGLVTYLNTVKSSVTFQMVKARAMLRENAIDAYRNKKLFDEVIEKDGITITKTISNYPASDNLIILELEAENAEKRKLGSWREIIPKE